MTTVLDLQALQAAAGIQVPLAENVLVRETTLDVTSEAVQGFSGVRAVELVVRVPVLRGHPAPSVTVTVQQSTNGSDWTTGHAFTFTATGDDSFTLDAPDDYLRVVCVPSGGLREAVVSVVASIVTVDATPGSGTVSEITSEDESVTITNPTGPTVDLSAPGGGSQPVGCLLSTSGDVAIGDGRTFLFDVIYDNTVDTNVLAELPAGIGFTYDPESGELTIVESGWYSFSLSCGVGADATWSGYALLGVPNISIVLMPVNAVVGSTVVVTSPVVYLPAGCFFNTEIFTQAEASGTPPTFATLFCTRVA